MQERNRGYYMAAQRYEISPGELKHIPRVSAANDWNIFQHDFFFHNGWFLSCLSNWLSVENSAHWKL